VIKIELPFATPFMAPQKKGKCFFNPRSQEKQNAQILVRSQYQDAPKTRGIGLKIVFEVQAPISTSKKKIRAILGLKNNEHTKRPDLDNLLKFLLDVLKGIVFVDDSQVHLIEAKKIWSYRDYTTVELWEKKND